MTLTRFQLPIVSPCEEFVGTEASAAGPGFCTRCDKAVHDLTFLDERQVISLLARNGDNRLCVAYRTRKDGSIVTRAKPSRLAAPLAALTLAACAGHVTEHERGADPECIDQDGYLTGCRPPRLGDAVIPEAEPVSDEASVDEIDAPPDDAAHAEAPHAEAPHAEGTDEMQIVKGGLQVLESSTTVVGAIELDGTAKLTIEDTRVTSGGAIFGSSLAKRVASERASIAKREQRRARRQARKAEG